VRRSTSFSPSAAASVLDGSKFIAAAIPFEGEPWDITSKGAAVESATPLASILTLPATAPSPTCSPSSAGVKPAKNWPSVPSMSTRSSPSSTPRRLSPAPASGFKWGRRCLLHVCETVHEFPAEAHIQDRFAESILKTLIEVGPRTLANPTNYDDRATFVWSATLALNGLIGSGVPQDWATHMIGHELTALYNIDHARTLAVIMPHLFRVQSSQKEAKLLQFAERIWGINSGSTAERIEAAIMKTEEFFESMGLPTRLSRYENIQPATPSLVAEKLKGRGFAKLGEKGEVGPDQVVEILTRSLAA